MATQTFPTSHPATTPDSINDYALARIDFRVHQLRWQFGLSDQDQEDVRNDMVVELLQAMKRFNPAVSKRETFINRVLDRFVLYITRQRCTKMRRPCDSPLGFEDVSPGYQPRGNDPSGGEMSAEDLVDLRIDLESVISQLPERDQAAARLLMIYSSSEVAKRIGVQPIRLAKGMGVLRTQRIRTRQSGRVVVSTQQRTRAPHHG